MSAARVWLTGLLAGLAATLAASAASADEADEIDFEHARHGYASPQNFAFEVRFGPYRPDIDSKFPNSKPYESVFGDGKGFYVGLELDWQALRIPYVGTFGPGIGWGYTHHSATALLSASKHPSGEDTYLTIMPMYLAGVLRVDVLPRALGIPLVGYGKFGLGYGLWSTGNDTDVSTVNGVQGKGRSWGGHLALGGAFLLDALDRSSARDLDNSTGVNHTYIFAEWMRNDLGALTLFDSKPQLHIGTSTWVAGMAFEM